MNTEELHIPWWRGVKALLALLVSFIRCTGCYTEVGLIVQLVELCTSFEEVRARISVQKFRPFLNQGKQTLELAPLPADVTIRSASATFDISNTPTAFKLDM